jgi:hypothetical protein
VDQSVNVCLYYVLPVFDKCPCCVLNTITRPLTSMLQTRSVWFQSIITLEKFATMSYAFLLNSGCCSQEWTLRKDFFHRYSRVVIIWDFQIYRFSRSSRHKCTEFLFNKKRFTYKKMRNTLAVICAQIAETNPEVHLSSHFSLLLLIFFLLSFIHYSIDSCSN